jgi:hypothetical protein
MEHNMTDIDAAHDLIKKHGPALQKTFELIATAATNIAEGMRLLSQSFDGIDAPESARAPAVAASTDHVHEVGSCTHCDTGQTVVRDANGVVGRVFPLPVELPPITFCDKDCALKNPHDGPCLDAEDAAVVNPEEIREPVFKCAGAHCPGLPYRPTDRRHPHTCVDPADTAQERDASRRTATEWAMSKHFLAYVGRNEPFNSWTAGQQNDTRDRFVAAQPKDEVLARWGKRFSAFCGVA